AEGGTLTPYGAKSVPEEQVYSIVEVRDGSLWLSTSHGLRAIADRGQDLRRPMTKSLIGAIAEDHEGSLWFGTLGDGLIRVQGGRETAFQAPAALPNNSVTALLEDLEQNIWVGTSDGLVRMSAPVVSVLNSRDGLSDDNF